MKYFSNITTPEELKKQFHSYCLTMHPDKGGDPEEFKTMLAEYEEAAKNCGAWTKETREEVQGVRRGLRVIFFGPGMMETRYIITGVQGDNIKMVRIFSHDFKSLEDIDSYLGGEWDDEKSRRELNKYDHIRPLSQKFGIGYYWDDEEQKTYTEQEISEAERIADNFDRWAANWKANKEEEERRAQEESDREEAAIIAQWSSILEQLPEEYKRPEGLSWYDMTNEQREAEKIAERKSSAARLAAFKRNLKAVFNYYWPGVKCSFKISRSIYGNATISWTDGPTIAEVKACEVFNYFLAHYYKSDPYADHGDVYRRTDMCNFRQMFGAFNCDSIDYNRNLSEQTADKLRQIIADNFPEAEKARQEAGEKYEHSCCTFDLSANDLSKLCALLGFVRPAMPDWETATDEEKEAYFAACEPWDNFERRVRNRNYTTTNDSTRMYYRTLWNYFLEFYRIEAEPQKEKKTRKAKAEQKATEQPANDTANDEAPAEGLQLVEIAEGVAVVGDSRTTFRNRKQIKAHGARWNKEAQQWQASEPEAVARLREWFGVSATPTAEEADTANESEPQGEEQTAPTAQSEHTPTTTSDSTEPTATDSTEPTETGSTTAQTGADATLYEAGEITATAPTDTAEDFAEVLAADRLKLLRSAAADFDRLTQAGEHVAAVNARLSALFACGVDVADLVHDADYKADQRARQRAAVVLTADEFRTLYGFSKEEQPEDCGRVWQFERGTADAGDYELHEIRRVPSGFMVFFNVCEATGGGCSTMVVYPTYCAALEVLTRCRPGAQLIAQPAV